MQSLTAGRLYRQSNGRGLAGWTANKMAVGWPVVPPALLNGCGLGGCAGRAGCAGGPGHRRLASAQLARLARAFESSASLGPLSLSMPQCRHILPWPSSGGAPSVSVRIESLARAVPQAALGSTRPLHHGAIDRIASEQRQTEETEALEGLRLSRGVRPGWGSAVGPGPGGPGAPAVPGVLPGWGRLWGAGRLGAEAAPGHGVARVVLARQGTVVLASC